jgi:hypothetical protein
MNTNKIINITFFASLIALVGVISYKKGKVIREEVKDIWGI